MENIISEEKIQKELDIIDKRNGLSEKDKELARGDIIAGIDTSVIIRYLKKDYSYERKKNISIMLRLKLPQDYVLGKYLDKKFTEESIIASLQWIAEGIDPLYVDRNNTDRTKLARLGDYWLIKKRMLETQKAEEQTEEAEETSDGLIRNPESENEDESITESTEIEKAMDVETQNSDEKEDDNPTEKTEEKLTDSENESALEEKNNTQKMSVVPQNTVITNGFTFEQMKELINMINGGSNEQKMHGVVSDEVSEPKQPQADVLTEERLQAIVSAAMKQTIEEAKKQTLEEINKEISELRREADESKKSENALRNEFEKQNKETANRMKNYFDKIEMLRDKPEEDKHMNDSESDSEKTEDNLEITGYIMPLKDKSGNVVGVMPVEIERKKTSGIGCLLGILGFKKKSQQSLVRMVISGELNKAQLGHIVGAMKKGLSEGQLIDLIESKVAAEKMPEIIEIALLEKNMGYAY